MTYLLWGLLNIGLFILFIAVCFKATKLVREKMGTLASILFVFGLLSFMGHAETYNENKEPNSNQIRTWKFSTTDTLNTNDTYLTEIELEKTLISKYDLGIKYGKDKQGQINIPISAYSIMLGITSGTNWKPVSIFVNRTNDNNKFEYLVHGIVEWKLLGSTIYSQSKSYKGIAAVK